MLIFITNHKKIRILDKIYNFMQLSITNHGKIRYIERINNGIDIDNDIILDKINNGKDITNKIYDEMPMYILYLYKKYGELGQTIIKSDNVIFIIKNKSLITCYLNNEQNWQEFKNTFLSRQEIFLKIKEIKRKIKLEKYENHKKHIAIKYGKV